MDDIEDIIPPEDGNVERKSTGQVAIKTFKKRNANPETIQKESTSFLPGQATVFVKTWGCGHNNSDGEYMAGLLAADGYGVVLESNQSMNADVWVLNSCTVKGPSQQTFANDIQKGIDAGKKVIVAGCVPQGETGGEEWRQLSVIGVQQIDQVVHVVEETLKGNTVKLLRDAKEVDESGKKRKAGGAPLNLRKSFFCLNQCTYCKTKHARGDLGSYSPEEIIARVKSVLDEGVLEIWLTSEGLDIGAYGRDIGVSIVDLLEGIVEAMENHPSKKAMLRIGMTNPPYILEHLENIAKILNHPRVYSFLHVPVQAGSTKVLDDMRRLYTIEDFEKVCDVLLARVPNMTLATDVICGFPTESEEDFDETMRILEKYHFSVLHISQFYPRPGTPAARMKRINTQIVKNRSRRATQLFNSYTSYDYLVGKKQKILITESSTDGKHFVGHNKHYHQVLVEKNPLYMGQEIEVTITMASKWYLLGEITPESLSKIDVNGTVSQQRIPKLVRKNKEIVSLESEKSIKSDQRADGSLFSKGDLVEDFSKDSNDQVIGLSKNMKYLTYGAYTGLLIGLVNSPIRNSTKLALVAVGAVITKFITDK
ncbi:hypothetical protein HDV02_000049 [Globomyces sp. JEL0801]|nr:hypothetical protein HDV02_000049 [Globomyces sp. JEL0801]